MHVSLIMVEGDHLTAVGDLMDVVGLRKTGRVRTHVPGVLVWQAVERMTDTADGPTEVLRMGAGQGWTMLGDDSGRLVYATDLWADFARENRTRVVALYHDPILDVRGFAVYDAHGLARAVDVTEGTRAEVGRALPIEAGFSGLGGPSVDDLLLLVQSHGIDFDHLNVDALYDLVEVAAA